LASVADRALRQTCVFGPTLKQHAKIFGAHKGFSNISIVRTGIKSNKPIALWAVCLKPIPDFLCPLSEYMRALRAFYSHFFINHEMPSVDPAFSARMRPMGVK
jgi:hypothetical protein